MSLRLTIHTTLSSKTGTAPSIWFPFEVDEPDLEAVYGRLVKHGAIFGKRVTTRPDADGRPVVIDRVPYIVAAGGIATIGPCHLEYREADEK